MMTNGDKVGLGIAAIAAAAIGYELWKNKSSTSSQPVISDLNPNTHKTYTSTGYKQSVNQAQGYSITLSNGQHEFVFGEYPMQSNGQLSDVFVPSGKTYIWGTGNVSNG